MSIPNRNLAKTINPNCSLRSISNCKNKPNSKNVLNTSSSAGLSTPNNTISNSTIKTMMNSNSNFNSNPKLSSTTKKSTVDKLTDEARKNNLVMTISTNYNTIKSKREKSISKKQSK